MATRKGVARCVSESPYHMCMPVTSGTSFLLSRWSQCLRCALLLSILWRMVLLGS